MTDDEHDSHREVEVEVGVADDPGAPEDPDDLEAFETGQVPGGLRAAVEGVLMVVEEPVSVVRLAAALEAGVEQVREVLVDLADQYEEQQRGFVLREVAGGWRFYSRPDLAPVVQRFALDGQTSRLSPAALETLAVIAYRQPVSRARVAAVRGVSVDGVVRTLTTRGLIAEVGVDEQTGALLYGTTREFLERLGLSSLDELPPLAPYLPDTDVLDELVEVIR